VPSGVATLMNILRAAFALTLAALLGSAFPLGAQSPMELLRSVRQGGGWISIPVAEGEGRLTTDTLPTLGLRFEGCLTVWGGHSGAWTIDARDPVNGERLDATVIPGQGVRFDYQSGRRSQVDVRIRWTEPRDTVLLVWVGLDQGEPDRDPCTPVYSSGRDRMSRVYPSGDARRPRRGSTVVARASGVPAAMPASSGSVLEDALTQTATARERPLEIALDILLETGPKDDDRPFASPVPLPGRPAAPGAGPVLPDPGLRDGVGARG